MAPPKDIARSYPKRGLTADVGFRSEPFFCADGSVLLDGSSDFAETAASSDLAVGDTFTLTTWLWLNPNPGSSSKFAIRVGDPGASSTASIGVFGGANPGFYSWSGAAAMSSSITCDSARWYHVATVIKSGAGNSQLFVNGVDVTSSNSVTFNVTSSSSTIRIGDFSTGGNDWEGHLANACLFTESLTEDQVRQVMRASDYASHAAISTVEAFYPLSANFNDSTGNHDATLSGSATFGVYRPQLPRGLDLTRGAAQARCLTGRAVDFDGSADGAASTATLNINTSGAKATLACWVNPDGSTSGNKTIVSNAVDTNNNQFTIYQNGTSYAVSAVYASGFTKVNHFADNQVKANNWTFLCAVWDFDTTSLTFYVNGSSFTDTPSTAIGSTNGVFEIGCRDPAGTKSQLFDGQIASIKLFDTTLTAAQVRELYHNPERVLPTGVSASNLRRYYPLSDYNDSTAGGMGGRYFQDMGADGEPAEDKGSSSMSFAQPVPCPQLGLQQSAMRMYHPGASQGAAATITAPGTTVSLSAWIFWDQSRVSYPIALGTVTTTTNSFNIRIDVSGNVTLYQNVPYLSGLTITEGGWNHLVFTTRSDSPYWRCWLNNSEASSPAVSNVTNITSTDCRLGMNSSSFGMAGIANDAAVWNTELGDSDVAALYNSGVQGMDVSTVQSGNLLGWWKFDDLTTLKDFSGNGANATVSGTFDAASFPENASGSTIVGDFSMKRKGVSILNLAGADDGVAIIPAQEAVYPKAGASNGYTVGFCYRKIKDGTAMIWGNTGTSANNQFMCFQQVGPTIRFNLGDGSSRPAITTSNLTDSDWHHYTLTISYATTPAEVKIYVDGVVDHSSTQSITGPPTDIRDMRLGDGLFDSQSPVGCFKFYHVALSADEVKRLAFSELRLIKGLQNE